MANLFKFDLKTPLQTGTLSKQGQVMKAFKKRFFVLYPDFLVYYDDSQKWNGDVWRGSLASRSGAVYLKNATCSAADEECRFGLLVAVPDQRNKRRSLLLCAADETEQSVWIAAISKATPSGTKMGLQSFVQPERQDVESCRKEEKCNTSRSSSDPMQPNGPAALMSTAFREAMVANPSLQRGDEGTVHINKDAQSAESTCIADHNGFKFDSSHLTAVGAETITIQTF